MPGMLTYLLYALLPAALCTSLRRRPALDSILMGLAFGWPGVAIVWMTPQCWRVELPAESTWPGLEKAIRRKSWLDAYRSWETSTLRLALFVAIFAGLAARSVGWIYVYLIPRGGISDLGLALEPLARVFPSVWPNLAGILALLLWKVDWPWRELVRRVEILGLEEEAVLKVGFWVQVVPALLVLPPAVLTGNLLAFLIMQGRLHGCILNLG